MPRAVAGNRVFHACSGARRTRRAGASARAGDSTGKKAALLADGNPQIPRGDVDAPAHADIAAMPGRRHDVGRRLDALVVRTVPGVRTAVRWYSPHYGIEGRGWFRGWHRFTKCVKVAFHRGTSLDPAPPVAAKHPLVRHVHMHEDERLDEPLLASCIPQAAELPGEPLSWRAYARPRYCVSTP